jgi:hypothetical protein
VTTPAGFAHFPNWRAVLEYAAAGGPLYYHAPLDFRPVKLWDYKVRARTLRIWPHGSRGRGRMRTHDPFTADKGHLNRFLYPVSATRADPRSGRHRRDPAMTPRRAAIIEQAYGRYERAREAHHPKKFKRGGGYTPEEERSIASRAGLKRRPSNRAMGKLELHRFMSSPPDHLFTYYKHEARVGEAITNWMGDVLGHVTYRGRETRPFGGRVVRIRMRGRNGVDYAGTCNLSSGTYCRLRRVQSRRR